MLKVTKSLVHTRENQHTYESQCLWFVYMIVHVLYENVYLYLYMKL